MPARYRVNTRKIVEVILWLAEKQAPIDFYHVLKIVFYADKYHLNAYGRPIVGDTYKAMNHGPVAQTIYAILKQDALELQALDAYTDDTNDSWPFKVYDRYWIHPNRGADRSRLSKSDMEALDWAFTKYGSLSFKELEQLTHDEPGWKNAFLNNQPMRYEDLLEDGPYREERAENLEESAPNLVL